MLDDEKRNQFASFDHRKSPDHPITKWFDGPMNRWSNSPIFRLRFSNEGV